MHDNPYQAPALGPNTARSAFSALSDYQGEADLPRRITALDTWLCRLGVVFGWIALTASRILPISIQSLVPRRARDSSLLCQPVDVQDGESGSANSSARLKGAHRSTAGDTQANFVIA
jgi:hypothetical protein